MIGSAPKKHDHSPKSFVAWALAASVLLMVNTIGWSNSIYGAVDNVLSPFVIVMRDFANSSRILVTELNNKSDVLSDNIKLKRSITEYEELKVKNKELQDQISKLEAQTKIASADPKNFKLVKVIGVQNIFSPSPEILININKNYDLKVNDVVYYETNTILGFVKDVKGNTARVSLFFSPEIKFNIPVQSVRDPAQKGFVKGFREGNIIIQNVSKDFKVNEGDTWITTNDVPEVKPNLIIGKVKAVRADTQDGFQELEIAMPFTLPELTYVLIED
jgi:cell shape-determining protein MreC